MEFWNNWINEINPNSYFYFIFYIFSCDDVRPSETLFFFSPKRSYGPLKPYITLSNLNNITNITNKTNKTKEWTYPLQLPDPTKGLFCIKTQTILPVGNDFIFLDISCINFISHQFQCLSAKCIFLLLSIFFATQQTRKYKNVICTCICMFWLCNQRKVVKVST